MNIGDVSEQSGLPAKTIRYYEQSGLVRPSRSENGYRVFESQDLHKLTFLCRARSLGFRVDECRNLLSLYEDRERSSSDVKEITERHDHKIAELQSLSATLRDLVDRCNGDDRPECPIVNNLAHSETP